MEYRALLSANIGVFSLYSLKYNLREYKVSLKEHSPKNIGFVYGGNLGLF